MLYVITPARLSGMALFSDGFSRRMGVLRGKMIRSRILLAVLHLEHILDICTKIKLAFSQEVGVGSPDTWEEKC